MNTLTVVQEPKLPVEIENELWRDRGGWGASWDHAVDQALTLRALHQAEGDLSARRKSARGDERSVVERDIVNVRDRLNAEISRDPGLALIAGVPRPRIEACGG